MRVEFGFEVCRVCLKPVTIISLLSLFDENGEKAKMLEIIAGIDISKDKTMHDALICDECLQILEKAFELRRRSRDAERFYFQKKREEYKTVKVVSETIEISSRHPTNKKTPTEAAGKRVEEREILDEILRILNEPDERKVLDGPVECSICHKKLVNKQCLGQHIESVHQKLRKFACDLCAYKCNQKDSMKRHICCHIKNAKFKPRVIDVFNDNRHFKCTFDGCMKYFTRKTHLKAHQATHSDARPFVCWCGKDYKTKGKLKCHQINSKKLHDPQEKFSRCRK